MSIVQVANVHFNSTGSSRIESPSGNAVAIQINSANTVHIAQDQVTVKTNVSVTGTVVGNTTFSDNVITSGLTSTNINVTGDIAIAGNIYGNGIGTGTGNVWIFSSPGTWFKPAGLKRIKVTVIGGGGSSSNGSTSPYLGAKVSGGGGGGAAIKFMPASSIPGPVTVTIGAGGPSAGAPAPITPGGTSSFGAHASATGGTSARHPPGGPDTNITPGGTGSGGDINISGGYGGYFGSAGGSVTDATSGTSLLSGSKLVTSSVALAGTDPGQGATGFGTPPADFGTGAAGAAGIVIVEEFY